MNWVRRSIGFIGAMFLCVSGFAANGVEVIRDGPIHEAFLTREYGQIILDAVPSQPPEEINERIPAQTDQQSQWIPGYWAWSKDRNDHVWVSGVWRRPPPGHQWIGGYWKDFDEGWAWINGFWSEIPENRLEYIDETPPDQIDERIPSAPSQEYFWIKGYWFWDSSQSDYVWYSGRWELFDQNWVFVPAHYVWREEGYVFVPSYWDWPLEARGVVYAAAAIDPAVRMTVFYEPVYIIDPLICIQIYYPWWPDYLFLFHHHFHFHLDFWISWGAAPPWWFWDSWWGFGWGDSWWLWWWWGHPGFPHPFWLEMEMAAMMAPPPGFVLALLSQVLPPPIVLADGVIGPNELIDAIKEVTNEDEPIMPSDSDETEDVQDEATVPQTPDRPYLKPTGPSPDSVTPPTKPSFGPENGDLSKPPQVTKPPPKPTEPPARIKPPRRAKPPLRRVQPRPSRPPRYTPPSTTQPPTYTPPPRRLRRPRRPRPPTYRPPTYTPPSTTRPPSYTPPSRPPRYKPPSRPPSYTPSRPPSYTPPPTSRTPTYTPPSRAPRQRYRGEFRAPRQQRFTPSAPRRGPSQTRTAPPSMMYQGTKPEVEWPPQSPALFDRGNYMIQPMPQVNPEAPKAHEPQKHW